MNDPVDELSNDGMTHPRMNCGLTAKVPSGLLNYTVLEGLGPIARNSFAGDLMA